MAEYYKIKLADMHSKKRSRDIARPRQIAMALAKELTQLSLPNIGDAFGGRDHTTVLHACKTIAEMRTTDMVIERDYKCPAANAEKLAAHELIQNMNPGAPPHDSGRSAMHILQAERDALLKPAECGDRHCRAPPHLPILANVLIESAAMRCPFCHRPGNPDHHRQPGRSGQRRFSADHLRQKTPRHPARAFDGATVTLDQQDAAMLTLKPAKPL